MNIIWIYTLLSVLAVSLVSFVGLLSFGIRAEKLKVILIYFISFAAGALFGDAFFHVIPEIAKEQGFEFYVSVYFLLGIIIFFLVEKFVHWQHYHSPAISQGIKPFAYVNLIGDVVHNFGDGLIIGASYLASVPVGIATTIAVAFHEIPHEIGNFSVLLHGGFTRNKALVVNFITALFAVIGALFALILSRFVANTQNILLPIVAGGFIYIAGSDLIPELHKDEPHTLGKSLLQTLCFVLGMALMAMLLVIG